MRIALVYIQVRCEQPEGPEGNVSRYTVRPGTVGLTLYTFQSYSTPSQSRRTLLEGFVFKGTTLFLFLLALHWQLLTPAMSAV